MLENAGPNCTTGKCRTENAGPEYAGLENEGPKPLGKMQDQTMRDRNADI